MPPHTKRRLLTRRRTTTTEDCCRRCWVSCMHENKNHNKHNRERQRDNVAFNQTVSECSVQKKANTTTNNKTHNKQVQIIYKLFLSRLFCVPHSLSPVGQGNKGTNTTYSIDNIGMNQYWIECTKERSQDKTRNPVWMLLFLDHGRGTIVVYVCVCVCVCVCLSFFYGQLTVVRARYAKSSCNSNSFWQAACHFLSSVCNMACSLIPKGTQQHTHSLSFS